MDQSPLSKLAADFLKLAEEQEAEYARPRVAAPPLDPEPIAEVDDYVDPNGNLAAYQRAFPGDFNLPAPASVVPAPAPAPAPEPKPARPKPRRRNPALDDDFGAMGAVAALDGMVIVSTRLGEVIYGYLGPLIAEKGWAVIPQEQSGRMPAKVDGERLKWSQFQDVGPDLETVERWARQAIGMNAAIVLGRASSNVFAVDIDVTDEMLSWSIQAAADETLGRTEFVRVGHYPKAAIFFRVADAEDLPANRSFRLLEEDGETVSPHLVEILGQGKLLTVNGRHHKTGDRFSWMRGASPSTHGPEAAPVVTAAQIEKFLEKVEKLRGFERKGGTASSGLVEMSWASSDGIEVPSFTRHDDAGWTEQDGLVVDGRDSFILRLTLLICRANAGACVTGEGRAKLMAAAREEYDRRVAPSGKWPESRIARTIREKTERTAKRVVEGEITPMTAHREKRVLTTSKEMKGISFSVATEDTKPVILPDVDEEAAKIASKLGDLYTRWLGASAQHHLDLIDPPTPAEDEDDGPPIYASISTVGTGKSTKLISKLASSTFISAFAALPPEFRRTQLMLLPGHAVAAEIAEKAEAAGLRVLHLYGKGRPESGCVRAADHEALQAQGMSGAGLCHASVKKEGRIEKGERTTEDRYCPFHPDSPEALGPCKPETDRASMLEYDLIVTVHSYMSVPSPALMKRVAGVIIDEAVWGQMLHERQFDRTVLQGPRKLPYMTKAEKLAVYGREDVSGDQVADWARSQLENRARLATYVEECWRRGKDPARGIALGVDQIPDAEETHERTKRERRAAEMQACLASALLVASRAQTRNLTITPTTTPAEILEAGKEVPGRHLADEARLWRILGERVERYRAAMEGNKPMPRGLDPRIKPLVEDRVQIAWRTVSPFAHLPTLLLDASADEEILTETFGRRPVIEKIETTQRMHVTVLTGSTYSKSALLDGPRDSAKGRFEKRAMRKQVRQLIAQTAAENGSSRVLICCPMAVEQMLRRHWRMPGNVDILHFGDIRGKDWAKSHGACIVIGAMYPNRTNVDGLVAAITPDEEEVEDRLDPDGTGDTPDGLVHYVDREFQLRDGRTVKISTQEFTGRFASKFMKLIRDEELAQAIGRLRAAYRTDMPKLYVVGGCLPTGIIVDEVEPLVDHIRNRGRLLSHGDGIADETRATNTGVWRRFLRAVDGDESLASSFHNLEAGNGARILVAGWVADDDVRSIAADRSAKIVRSAARSSTGKPPIAVPKPANALLEAVLAQRAAQGSPTAPIKGTAERKTAAMAAAVEDFEMDFVLPDLPPGILF